MQPADVCWFKSLKIDYKNKWNHWFLNDEKIFTKYGNIAGPGYVKMVSWITSAWKSTIVLPQTLVSDSFVYCGITSQNIDSFHSELKNILSNHVLPLNSTIEQINEDDLLNDIFVDDYDDDEDGESDKS